MASKIQTSEELLIEMSYPLEQFTEEGAWETFNGHAQFFLGIGDEKFLRRWDAGEWKDDRDQPGVISMFGLLPLVRPKRGSFP